MTKTDVIVVGYNQPEFEANTLKAVIAHTDPRTYRLTYEQNAPGRSLAAFWNELILQSPCEYICLLNPDTVPTPDWLSKLTHTLDTRRNVGAVVPSCNIVMWSSINTPFPREEQDWSKINAFAATLPPKITTCPVVSATCVVFPKRVWDEADRFDEEFVLYGEDTEFFYRVRTMCKHDLVWVHDAYVHHYKAQCVQKAVLDGSLDLAGVQRLAAVLMERKMGHNGAASIIAKEKWSSDGPNTPGETFVL